MEVAVPNMAYTQPRFAKIESFKKTLGEKASARIQF